MKKILFYLLTLTILFSLSTSCDKDDPVVKDKRTLVSAVYSAYSQSFILTYSNKQTETVKATLNQNTTPPSATAELEDGTYLYRADADTSGKAEISNEPPVTGDEVNIVTQFVYDGMSLFYLWSNDVVNKKPTEEDNDPEEYFYSILNEIDTENGWSWITDDVNSLISGFEGESTDAFGFQPYPLFESQTSHYIIGFIRYVYPNTPAETAGLKRGEIIYKINGQRITIDTYGTMYGANTTTTFEILDQNWENPREVEVTPAAIKTNPVLYSKVYEIEGKKIGYLFYTQFIENYNDSLHKAFSEFKSAGITDLVLDLRYNPGGGISAANYLASLIAPESAVRNKEVFSIMSYNDFVNNAYDNNNWDRKDYLGYYNDKFTNPLTANLNLNKLYVIATESSASASELVTFCLEPYMQIEHIGEKTSGKYTASWTIHPYNDYNGRVQSVYDESSLSSEDKSMLKNWGMQPIVGRYTDKNNKDFIATNGLIPDHPITTQERNTVTWKPIGDINDYLFAKALSLITGKPYTTTTRSFNNVQLRETNLYSPMEEVFRSSVIIDNPKLIPSEQ